MRIAKKPLLVKNAIVQQLKTAANGLTISDWNNIINILKQQANYNTEHIDAMHRVIFGDYNANTSGYIEVTLGIIPDFINEIEGYKQDIIDLQNDKLNRTEFEEHEITADNKYVQKDGAKVLSTNDYTDADKDKVAGAEVISNKTSDLSSKDNNKYPTVVSVKEALDFLEKKLSTVYRPAGSRAELLESMLVEANAGDVYNMTAPFITNELFLNYTVPESFNAGENVVVIYDAPNDVYRFDVLSGLIDLSNYVEKEEILTTEDVTINTKLGVLSSGTKINAGTSITDLIKLLGIGLYYPTHTLPTLSLNISIGNVEAGYTSDIILTALYNPGEILGKIVGGAWMPDVKQNDKAGAVTRYGMPGIAVGEANKRKLENKIIAQGANNFSISVDYAEGPQAVDSEGANFGEKYSAGTISKTKTILGYRKLFYGTTPAVTSAEIRSLTGILDPKAGTKFNINITAGVTDVVIAYPKTIGTITSIIYKEGLNADIKEAFTVSETLVEGANGYTAITYYVYTYTPLEAFTGTATYEVTI